MKTSTPDSPKKRNRRGIALITVVSVLAVLVILTVAMMTLSRSERTSATLQAHQEESRELADTAVNIVMGQIWEGSKPTTPRKIWASQPGAIRRYDINGVFNSGYRLYSSGTMVVESGGGDAGMLETIPDNWSEQNARYVDLNEPVVRPNTGTPKVYYPIIDPRAYIRADDQLGELNTPDDNKNRNVEGFWYDPSFSGVIDPANRDSMDGRLPMPVEWLYVLKDGTIGALGDTNQFVTSPGGSEPSLTNPIVGRIAFWTDDETSKININTASEPTPWGVPSVYHDREQQWAMNQPTAFEYQRYPGHPATIALSTVIFPNYDMDIYGKKVGGDEYDHIIKMKDSIYALAPKIALGGSRSGTVPFWKYFDVNRYGSGKDADDYIDLTEASKERLYPSVDDLLFSMRMDGDDKREQNTFVDSTGTPDDADKIFETPEDLERLRFFLTANSRMPELNMYGLPRVSMWPIFDETVPPSFAGEASRDSDASKYRTGFDKLIAFCSSMGRKADNNGLTRPEHTYFFRRASAESTTYDVNIDRNQELLKYLTYMMESPLPSYRGSGSSFADKYPSDYKQVLIQIFDYIRCTNLYDGFLAPTRKTMLTNSEYASPSSTENLYAKRPRNFYTFTRDRYRSGTNSIDGSVRIDGTFPGHGQVAPSYDSNYGMGFGRFPVISELGFHFICTADGDVDKGSFRMSKMVENPDTLEMEWGFDENTASGGRTAVKIKGGYESTPDGSARTQFVRTYTGAPGVHPRGWKEFPYDVWYSNYPPLPSLDTIQRWGVNYGAAADSPSNPQYHPGLNPSNWNYSLDPEAGGDATGTGGELSPGQRRVQGMLSMELSMVSAGFVPLSADFTMEVSGLSKVMINNQNVFAKDVVYYKSNSSIFQKTHARSHGGSADPYSLSQDRHAPGIGWRNADPQWDSTGASGGLHNTLFNFDLITNYFTIDASSGMNFESEPLTVKIYATHNTNDSQYLVQTYTFNLRDILFGLPRLPAPILVTISSDYEQWVSDDGTVYRQSVMHAPRWWSFSLAGVIGRYPDDVIYNPDSPNADLNNPQAYVGVYNPKANAALTLGRFFVPSRNQAAGKGGVARSAGIFFGYDPNTGDSFGNALIKVLPNGSQDYVQDKGNDLFSNTGVTDKGARSDIGPRDPRGHDVVFSVVPAKGDMRLIAGLRNVPSTAWAPQRLMSRLGQTPSPSGEENRWGVRMAVHNFCRFYSADYAPGYDRGDTSNTNLRLQQRIIDLTPNMEYGGEMDYSGSRLPDVAPVESAYKDAWLTGDFDTGPSNARDGAFINKPDEGDSAMIDVSHTFGGVNVKGRLLNAYLGGDYDWVNAEPGEAFMSPNRMISSPGMFGSLPVGVKSQTGWRTLLFRPGGLESKKHPGAAAHFGGQNGMAADHFLLDFFWMPVVEPYALSEPFSTAGKININYHIVPFAHIRRATGIHALLKGEIMAAYPTRDVRFYKERGWGGEFRIDSDGYGVWDVYSETDDTKYNTVVTNAQAFPRFWHRKVEAEYRSDNTSSTVMGTIAQMEDRFKCVANPTTPTEARGLFRTASQICEIYLMPKLVESRTPADSGDVNNTPYSLNSQSLGKFWRDRTLTGDNMRERPYANIYGKITTQSNTFRVHFRVQALRKARSTDPGRFIPASDSVLTDYRGSSLIERQVDLTNPTLLETDYGAANNPRGLDPVDKFYRFRVLETKRFMP